MRSLEKDPALRYQSAEEFIAALEQARRQPTRQIVMDQTPGEPWVDDAPAGSRWWVWVLVALVLAAAAAGAYVLLAGEKVDGAEPGRPQRRQTPPTSCTSAGWRSPTSTSRTTRSRATR